MLTCSVNYIINPLTVFEKTLCKILFYFQRPGTSAVISYLPLNSRHFPFKVCFIKSSVRKNQLLQYNINISKSQQKNFAFLYIYTIYIVWQM